MALKYKVGDKVRIKSLDWYENNKINGVVELIDNDYRGYNFIEAMSAFCGKVMTISNIAGSNCGYYDMKEDNGYYYWTDDMIEGLVGETITFNGKEILLKLANIELPSGTTNIWECPEGYQFTDENGNVINATKIVLEKKKKEYPKTFRECCETIGLCSDTLKWNNPFCINRDTHPYIKHLDNLIESFCKLIICRDAYWKIAGEEMGLGKPWKPNWTANDVKHSLVNVGNTMIPSVDSKVCRILTFPTKEIRDIFKENFKELIEQCKELL